MKTAILIKFTVAAFGISTICFANPCYAQPAILTINASQARGTNSRAIEVKVGRGRATAIDFSGVNERITQVFLADPSNFTYSTDTPLENGQSTTLFLRRIQPLKFPNLTTTNITNLFIKKTFTKFSYTSSRMLIKVLNLIIKILLTPTQPILF